MRKLGLRGPKGPECSEFTDECTVISDSRLAKINFSLSRVPVKNHIALPKNDTIGLSLIGSKTLIICPIDVLEGGIGLLKIFAERMRR